jgi:hypothetical protein
MGKGSFKSPYHGAAGWTFALGFNVLTVYKCDAQPAGLHIKLTVDKS